MDALKNITGAGSDKPKAEETKPGFVDSTKLAAGAAQTNVIDQSGKAKTTATGAGTNVVETAKEHRKSGQEAVGKSLEQAGEHVKPAAPPPAEAKKEESGSVIGDAVAKVGAFFNGERK